MVINPMCDMPWEIYLDYLSDQGFDELREINVYCFNSLETKEHFNYHNCSQIEFLNHQFNNVVGISGHADNDRSDGDGYNYYSIYRGHNVDYCIGYPVWNGFMQRGQLILYEIINMGDDNMEYKNYPVNSPGCGI